jgi:hypothetical protein
MATKVHPPSRHHCYNVDDLVPLLEQMGYHVGEKKEDSRIAVVRSVELCGLQYAAKIVLDKQQGTLTVTDNFK